MSVVVQGLPYRESCPQQPVLGPGDQALPTRCVRPAEMGLKAPFCRHRPQFPCLHSGDIRGLGFRGWDVSFPSQGTVQGP